MRGLYRYPKLNIVIIAVISLFFALQLPNIRLDNDLLNFIPENHPEAQAYERTSDLFGSGMIMGVGIEFGNSTIFEPSHIDLIKELTEKFEDLSNVESVLSLSNTDYIEGTIEGMIVHPLIGEEYQGTKEDILLLKQRLADWPMYKDVLYSDDFSASQILVTIEDDIEAEKSEALYFGIKDILESRQDSTFRYFLAGNPAMTVLITENMKSDMRTLIPMVVLVILAALLLFFRRIGGVSITIMTVLLSTIWTVGAMALLRIPLSIVATVIPVLMVAVGSAYGIHIISHYYDELEEQPPDIGPEIHREIIFRTMRKMTRPVFLAGLTTIAGFGALSTSQVIPIRNFGIFTAFGVLAAVIVALIFIPSLLLVRKHNLKPSTRASAVSQGTAPGDENASRKYTIVLTVYRFFRSRKLRILFLSLLIAIFGFIGASKVIRDNAIIEYFKLETEIRQADMFLRENFAGTEYFDIVIKGEKKGDLADPRVLKAMDDLARYLEDNFDKVAKVNSFSDLIKRMNQVMNYPPGPPEMKHGSVDTSVYQDEPKEPAGAEGGFFSFFHSSEEKNGESGGDFTEGYDSGFSVRAETSQETVYTDQFDDGEGFSVDEGESFDSSESFWSVTGETSTVKDPTAKEPGQGAGRTVGWQQQLQPVDFSQEFTYGDFVLLLNKIYAASSQRNLTAGELIESLNRELNYRGAAYYEIPYDPQKYPADTQEELKNLISQYLLLYSGSMDDWADDALEPTQVRMNVQMTSTGSRETVPIIQGVQDFTGRQFPEAYTIEITGSALVKNALTDLLIDAQTRSILISLTLVFVIIALNFRSIVAGIFGIIPMGFAILINFAVMGYSGIKLDISTAMIASVAIGIGIDYTIHFMSNYHYERIRSGDLETVTVNTLQTTGKAIIFNAVSVAAGFLVLVFSQFNPLMYFGMLIALTMFTSSLASMTLLPVLLNMFKPKFISKEKKALRFGG